MFPSYSNTIWHMVEPQYCGMLLHKWMIIKIVSILSIFCHSSCPKSMSLLVLSGFPHFQQLYLQTYFTFIFFFFLFVLIEEVFLSKVNHLTWAMDPISSCFLVDLIVFVTFSYQKFPHFLNNHFHYFRKMTQYFQHLKTNKSLITSSKIPQSHLTFWLFFIDNLPRIIVYTYYLLFLTCNHTLPTQIWFRT